MNFTEGSVDCFTMLSSHLPRRSKDNDKIFVIDDLLVVLLSTSDKDCSWRRYAVLKCRLFRDIDFEDV